MHIPGHSPEYIHSYTLSYMHTLTVTHMISFMLSHVHTHMHASSYTCSCLCRLIHILTCNTCICLTHLPMYTHHTHLNAFMLAHACCLHRRGAPTPGLTIPRTFLPPSCKSLSNSNPPQSLLLLQTNPMPRDPNISPKLDYCSQSQKEAMGARKKTY